MRCSESKNRLNKLLTQSLDLSHDKQLQEHIQSCVECAKDKELTDKLSLVLKAAGENDRIAMISLEDQKKLVESRIQGSGKAVPGYTVRPRFSHTLGYGFGAVVVTVLLLFMMPFGENHVTGYEVALHGVDFNLAENDEAVCDVLYTLGLDEAAVDIHGCDPTCSLMILDLKTKQEADLVVATFENLNSTEMSSAVIPIRASKQDSKLN